MATSETTKRPTIRNATADDESQMVELLFQAFDQWPPFEIGVPAIEHLRWKMRSDAIATRHHWVAEIDNRVVGMFLSIVRRARMSGRDYLLRDAVDAAVDPHFRGARVWGSLSDRAEAAVEDSEFRLGCGFVTNPRIWQQRKRKGRRPLANPVEILEKPYSARAIVTRRRGKYGGRLPAPLAVLRIKLETAFNKLRHWPYGGPAKRGWSITTQQRFDHRIGAFFDEATRPFEFVIVRNEEYLNWRYCEPAAGQFTIRMAEQEGKILGYLVYKVSEGVGYIADLLVVPGRIDVVRSLVEDVLFSLQAGGVELVSCWMTSRHPYNRILRRYGFLKSKRDAGFSCFGIGPKGPVAHFVADPEARIHITQGDSDWI